VDTYIAEVLARFGNPSIRHKLSQIAWDGSQKLPVRLLSTTSEAPSQGRDIAPLCLAIAGWMLFVRRQARDGVPLVDPLNGQLTAIGRTCSGDVRADVAAFLALDAVFGSLARDTRFVASLRVAYAALGDGSAAAAARLLA
jgi:fructuronate reductase